MCIVLALYIYIFYIKWDSARIDSYHSKARRELTKPHRSQGKKCKGPGFTKPQEVKSLALMDGRWGGRLDRYSQEASWFLTKPIKY